MRVEKYYYKIPIIKTNNSGDFVQHIVELYRDENHTDLVGQMQDSYVHQKINGNEWVPHFKTKVVTFPNGQGVAFCYIANKMEPIKANILYKTNMHELCKIKREIIKTEDNPHMCHGVLKFHFK